MIPRISGRTKVCALIGDPVEHSLSPSIQNAAFEAIGLDYVYVALRVAPESLYDALSGIRALGFHGLNVTMPHKASVIRYLDGLNDDARRIGAVNTVLNSKGRLLGYNTDGLGALQALRSKGVEPEGRKIVILGAGGASRAIVYSLSRLSCQVSVLNRTPERAE
ncbi:shikimate dehydrogenase, partial [Candidatus Bathyarchaeota archaeon]|nr:shikimate dehydrogenase [Candidatus Bathyarchaeota archaeon]